MEEEVSGLKVKKNIKAYIPKIVLGVVLLLLGVFLLKVYVWEKHYYADMEGKERAPINIVGDIQTTETIEYSDEEITEEEIQEYTVAPDMPRYLYIDKFGIKSRVLSVGTLANGQMGTPISIYDTGWWNGSNKPGTGGTAILNGHNGINVSGVFKNLSSLVAGDQIKIELGDGTVLTYRVYDNVTVSLEEADERIGTLGYSPVEGTESISLISCTGDWSLTQQTMLERVFVRATLVNVTKPQL